MPELNIYSEKYSATGSMAGDGFRKLLGTPDMDQLQTLLRETVQNSCDAALPGKTPIYRFHIRKLTRDQVVTLRDRVLHELPADSDSEELLKHYLNRDSLCVIEVSDFHTSGLAGPVRADRVPPEGEPTDFIDFLRNIGSRRDTQHGGGTYGYGKTSLYNASRCRTILVDSQTTNLGQPVRRFMGCHLGHAHDIVSGPQEGRYTGRHWWGHIASDGHIDPLEAKQAEEISRALGMPERSESDTGTTIMILNPDLVGERSIDVSRRVIENLLWWFWPRMVDVGRDGPATGFEVLLDDNPITIPSPENYPPLDLFVECMRLLKEKPKQDYDVYCRRPKKRVGMLIKRPGIRRDRKRLVSPELYGLIPATCHHIAVMRPVELVVRYYEGQPHPNEKLEWAGVFRCSDEDEVERAFAESEPPAHDNWVPKSLPSRSKKQKYVNAALRAIRQTAGQVWGAGDATGGTPTDQPSLAKAADLVGGLLGVPVNPPGQRQSPGTPRTGKAKVRIVRIALEECREGPVARFTLRLVNQKPNHRYQLHVTPGIMLDSGLDPDARTSDGKQPAVLSWISVENGSGYQTNQAEVLGIVGKQDIDVVVTIPGNVAVGLKPEIEDLGHAE